jgi:type II secretory pathway component PulK
MMRDGVGLMTNNRKTANRRGSALLVCTLAAAVLSMAAIAILRSSQRSIARVDSLRGSCHGRCVAEGLFQRAVAILRTNPNTTGTIVDPNTGMPGARCELRQVSVNATLIRVFLYVGSTTPAKNSVVDPTTI